MRNAGAERDRSDVHVAVVDVPAFFAGIGRTAADEGGHGTHQKQPKSVPIAAFGQPKYLFAGAGNDFARHHR
jgi:hypothetical protein